jgi:hypothetical protein
MMVCSSGPCPLEPSPQTLVGQLDRDSPVTTMLQESPDWRVVPHVREVIEPTAVGDIAAQIRPFGLVDKLHVAGRQAPVCCSARTAALERCDSSGTSANEFAKRAWLLSRPSSTTCCGGHSRRAMEVRKEFPDPGLSKQRFLCNPRF